MRTINTPSTRRCPAQRTRRAGFTLMELMLALAIGAAIVLFAWSLLGMLARASSMQSDRLQRATELADAHRIMTQAFRSLLMSSEQPPAESELKARIERNIAKAKGETAASPDNDAALARIALQPSGITASSGAMLQNFELTLRTAPAAGGLVEIESTEQMQTDVAVMREERREARRAQRQLAAASGGTSGGGASGGGSAATGSTASAGSSSTAGTRGGNPNAGGANAQAEALLDSLLTPEQKQELARRRSAGGGGGGGGGGTGPSGTGGPAPTGATGSTGLAGTPGAPAGQVMTGRAPGLRGVFEIRPAQFDSPADQVRALANDPRPTFDLYWREFPVDDTLMAEDEEEATDADTNTRAPGTSIAKVDPNLLALARNSRSDGREIRLISGLVDAKWEVYRQRTFVPKMTATFDRELPAYVVFKFETTEGRKEHWLFEVAWTNGAEPGATIQESGDLAIPVEANPLDTNGTGGQDTNQPNANDPKNSQRNPKPDGSKNSQPEPVQPPK